MNASRVLAAEEAVAFTAGVAGDLIAQGADKGLPRPRFLMAVAAFYGMLGLVASAGPGPARFATASGGVAALTTIVLGPGGKALTGLLTRLTGLASTAGTGFSGSSTSVFGQSPGPVKPGETLPGYQPATRAPTGDVVIVPVDPRRRTFINPRTA